MAFQKKTEQSKAKWRAERDQVLAAMLFGHFGILKASRLRRGIAMSHPSTECICTDCQIQAAWDTFKTAHRLLGGCILDIGYMRPCYIYLSKDLPNWCDNCTAVASLLNRYDALIQRRRCGVWFYPTSKEVNNETDDHS